MFDLLSLFQQEQAEDEDEPFYIPARSKRVQELKKKLAELKRKGKNV